MNFRAGVRVLRTLDIEFEKHFSPQMQHACTTLPFYLAAGFTG